MNKFAKTIQPVIERTVCKMYAIFCIALVEQYGWSKEQCKELCSLSQAYWNESNNHNIDIFAWCEEIAGLDMRKRVDEDDM